MSDELCWKISKYIQILYYQSNVKVYVKYEFGIHYENKSIDYYQYNLKNVFPEYKDKLLKFRIT